MTPHRDESSRKSLRFSFFDGVFASAMIGFTQDYFIPFLLLIGGTARHVGILSSLPNLAASLIQLASPDITDKVGSRRKIINFFVFMQALVLIPISLLALTGKASPFLFIVFVTLFTACGACVLPAWGSLMSDLIKEDKRGQYFGWRNKVLGFIMVGFTFAAGIILTVMKKVNIFQGFFIIFAAAALFRLLSWYFLRQMHEPLLEQKKEDYFNLINFLVRIKESNFARFVLFVAMLNFSVNVASPFFAVLMLRDLHFDYFLYTALTVTTTCTIYVVISRWGRHADKIGNLKVVKFTAPIISILPLLWVFNRHPAFLFFAQIVSGFAWAGFNLSASNFIYDVATPAKRTRCIAYFNVINGFALALGGLVGGFLVSKLPTTLGYQILTLFLISSVLRLGVSIFIPRGLKEVRPVEKVRNRQLFFSMLGIKSLLGVEQKVT